MSSMRDFGPDSPPSWQRSLLHSCCSSVFTWALRVYLPCLAALLPILGLSVSLTPPTLCWPHSQPCHSSIYFGTLLGEAGKGDQVQAVHEMKQES